MSISLKVARCLAKVSQTPWEKVEQQLWQCCPQQSAGSLLLTSRHQESVLALGIFYLESGFLHEDKILDYLLSVHSSLATATFPDEIPLDRRSKLPPAEIFSFNLTTLLNDIAVNNPATAERILETQVDLLSSLLNQLQQLMKQDKPAAFNTRRWTCKCVVPVLLGLSRAMARFSPPQEEFLISQIFPRGGHHHHQPQNSRKDSVAAGEPQSSEKMKGYTNFRYGRHSLTVMVKSTKHVMIMLRYSTVRIARKVLIFVSQ